MAEGADRREARRFTMSLPLRVMGQEQREQALEAQTRDVSYRGLYFLTDATFDIGNEIEFVITLPQQMVSSGDVNIHCHGEIVRVEPTSYGHAGVAAKIDRYEFVPAKLSAA
jgi:PilZ domain